MKTGDYVGFAGTCGQVLNIYTAEDGSVILKVKTIRNILRGQPYDLIEYNPSLVKPVSITDYAIMATKSSITVVRELGIVRTSDCAYNLENAFLEAFIDG